MKLAFKILLVFSFVGVAVFGFAMMGDGSGHHGGCLAALAQRTDCPLANSWFSFINFHLNAFRNFSAAVFGSLSLLNAAAIILVLVSAVALVAILGSRAAVLLFIYYFRGRQFSKKPPFLSERKFARWLAFHENSPALFLKC